MSDTEREGKREREGERARERVGEREREGKRVEGRGWAGAGRLLGRGRRVPPRAGAPRGEPSAACAPATQGREGGRWGDGRSSLGVGGRKGFEGPALIQSIG